MVDFGQDFGLKVYVRIWSGYRVYDINIYTTIISIYRSRVILVHSLEHLLISTRLISILLSMTGNEIRLLGSINEQFDRALTKHNKRNESYFCRSIITKDIFCFLVECTAFEVQFNCNFVPDTLISIFY